MCEAVIDCPHSTPAWTESGFVVLRNQNIKGGRLDLSTPSYTDEEHFKQRVRRLAPRAGDIVITREAPMGEVCKIPEGLICCLGQRQVLLRPKAGVSSDYLLFALQSPLVQDQIRWNEGTGSTVSNIRIPVLEKIEIPRLGHAEEHVAAALKSIDDKIDVSRRINQSLEAMAQAIFKSWFIDFDPVRAKIAAIQEGRDPLRAAMGVISGKSDAHLEALPPEQFDQLAVTAALFPHSMDSSEMGEIPSGWKATSVYEIATVIYGAPFASKLFNPNGKGTPIARIRDLKDEAPAVWTEETHPKGYKLKAGDVVVGMDGEFRAYLWGGEPAWLNQRMCVFKPLTPHSAAFVRYSIAGPLAHIEATEVATTVIHLGKGDIDKFKVVVPDDLVAMAFAEVANCLYATIVSNKAQIRSLSGTRDALLPKLLSGELSVEARIEPAGTA